MPNPATICFLTLAALFGVISLILWIAALIDGETRTFVRAASAGVIASAFGYVAYLMA